MADRVMITIPFHQDLTKQRGWTTAPEANHKYFVARFHFMLRLRQLAEPVRSGEVVDAFTSAPGMGVSSLAAHEVEYTKVDMRSLVTESLEEETSVLDFASTLMANLGLPALGKISGDVKLSANEQLKSSFSQTFNLSESETFRERITTSLTYTIDPEKFGADTRVVAVQLYKKRSCDLFLAFVDYLMVEYTRSPYGSIWLKRHKLPEAGNSSIRPNIMPLKTPLASIQYWELLPSAGILEESRYVLEVEDPLETFVLPLDRSMPPVNYNPKPTLYDLAEKAFRPKQLSLFE